MARAPGAARGNRQLSAPGRTSRAAGWVPVALALGLSIALVWVISREPLVVGAFGGAVLSLGALATLLALRRPAEKPAELAPPDWSVTVAAIDGSDRAVAITDRAGRLVCANPRFEQDFGLAHAPPRLDVADASLESLAQATRSAWRDGSGRVELVEPAADGARWRCTVARAGRGEHYLVWQFVQISSADPIGDLAPQLVGRLGRVLSQAGFSAAIVDPDGAVLAASAGLAERATGDAFASLAQTDFVALLRQEANDHIAWGRDDVPSGPLVLYHVPLADPEAPATADPAQAPALMLIADPGVGIGVNRQSPAVVPQLEALLSQLPLGLAMADRDGKLLFANAGFMRAARQEGKPLPVYPADFVVREDKAALSETVRRCGRLSGNAGDITVRLVGQPDEPVSLTIANVQGPGEPLVLLGLTDTTEEARLKRQIAQATKMQAVGQLAGGVAHDFNNVLTAILGTCDLMLMRHLPGDSDYDDIQQIRAASNRAASLTRQLLAFSRQQTLRPEVLQLPDVVSEATQLLRRLIGEKVELVVTHGRDLGPVRADPGQLGQVVMNLVVNARDAIHARGDGRGRVSVTTRRITPADICELQNEIIPAGEYTALVVGDNGGGIAPEHIGKIFEPFFTTKEQGRGTGLGLSTVYGFVKQSGGFVFADSEPGTGTVFTVYLPVDRAAPVAPEAIAKPVEPSAWAGGGRILLVEDEEPVRAIAARALTRQGYVVTAASDGEEGLELVRQGGEFDLVVSDVVMPIMDGQAMAREIRKLAPKLPVLFMSGYAEEQLRKQIGMADVHFLAKPFSVQDITSKVGSVLAAQ